MLDAASASSLSASSRATLLRVLRGRRRTSSFLWRLLMLCVYLLFVVVIITTADCRVNDARPQRSTSAVQVHRCRTFCLRCLSLSVNRTWAKLPLPLNLLTLCTTSFMGQKCPHVKCDFLEMGAIYVLPDAFDSHGWPINLTIFRLDAWALSVIATATWLAGWLAGWVSVTLRYCIKTAKPIRKLFRPSESPIILVFWDPWADTKFQGEPHQRGR